MKVKGKKQPEIKKSDFKMAKEVVNTLEIHKDVIVEYTTLGNIRKYLRELSKYIDKQYVTRDLKENKLKITRLK